MTDVDDQRARIEALRRRRAASPRIPGELAGDERLSGQTRSRPGASRSSVPRSSVTAGASKAVATGLGLATMFGLVAAMDVASASETSGAAPASARSGPAPVVVTVHQGSVGDPAATIVGPPVRLTARPTVRAVPVDDAPAARTSGSR